MKSPRSKLHRGNVLQASNRAAEVQDIHLFKICMERIPALRLPMNTGILGSVPIGRTGSLAFCLDDNFTEILIRTAAGNCFLESIVQDV